MVRGVMLSGAIAAVTAMLVLPACRRSSENERKALPADALTSGLAASSKGDPREPRGNRAGSEDAGDSGAKNNAAGVRPGAPALHPSVEGDRAKPPAGALDLSQRAQRVQERINTIVGVPFVLVLGQTGAGARVERGMMVTMDISVVASVSEDAVACLYARACAEQQLIPAPSQGAQGASGSPAGIERAAQMRRADQLAGRFIAQAGYRREAFRELLTALRGQDPRAFELAPFLSDDEREAAFREGYEKALSDVAQGQAQGAAAARP